MLHLILYHPEIPQNTGNILRTAAVLNAHVHIIGPLPFALDNKSLQRAGMDYIDPRHFTYYPDYDTFAKKVPAEKIYYVTRYGNHIYTEVDFSQPLINHYLMFGRESTGIDDQILRKYRERTLRIPMLATARSLNLSNAVAIVAYEVMRQQKFENLATQEQLKGPNFLK
ncbi:MAG: tRNA (cytidine(34)-2'-O)-methyltransferase [Bacilli bacterium]|jgi:tRNA (cytidine/uridine-2'-O-)-methyltransferase